MPVKIGKDKDGCFAQWGNQAKYHYVCGDEKAMGKAKQKATLQGVAATGGTLKEIEHTIMGGSGSKIVKHVIG